MDIGKQAFRNCTALLPLYMRSPKVDAHWKRLAVLLNSGSLGLLLFDTGPLRSGVAFILYDRNLTMDPFCQLKLMLLYGRLRLTKEKMYY
jgi:hypothetical protein